MRLSEYKNKLSEDLQYWKDVNEAKLPDSDVMELIQPLTDEDRQKLPNEICNFYFGARWFFHFYGSVVIPQANILLLFYKRHISECFKSFTVYDEHDICEAAPHEVYELLKYISLDSAKEICLNFCEKKEDVNNLMSCLWQDDSSGFLRYFSALQIPTQYLIAFTKTINLLKNFELSKAINTKAMTTYEEDFDLSYVSYAIKSHFSEVSTESEMVSDISDFAIRLIDAAQELATDKDNTDLQKYISENYDLHTWIKLGKRVYCMIEYNICSIWDYLSQEERNIADDIINPKQELTLRANDVIIRPTNDIIQLALRWSKITRQRILNQDAAAHNQIKTSIQKVSNLTFPVQDYREYFASKAPMIDYQTMRDIAVRLAGKVKKGNGLVDTGMTYIKNEDVARLCYFFLHDIGKDDEDRNIDFTKPIWWIGDKWSLRYFITQLYKTGKLPSNLAKAVVEVFRFSDVERNHNEEKGKIAASSFQDTKKYLKKLRHEDVERINHILKEFGL